MVLKTSDSKNKKKASSSNKKRRNVVVGVVHIQATFNNTIVSITDTRGNLITWSSTGKMSFKGSKKSTPYAAQITAQNAVEKAKEYGLQTVSVEIRGAGIGREAALRALQGTDLNITTITDNTYHPHNGCRPTKKRRP